MCCMVDPNSVVVCSKEKVIKMFDLAGDEPLCMFVGHQMGVTCIAS
jgi:hypothetical protein